MKCLVTLILVSLILTSNCSLVQWNEWNEWSNIKVSEEDQDYEYFIRQRTCSLPNDDLKVKECCFNDSSHSLSEWSSWDSLSNCSEICKLPNTILEIHNCTCLNTVNCTGAAIEIKKDCSFEKECPEYLSEWSLWDDCSVTCDNPANKPVKLRSRTCLRDDYNCLNAKLKQTMDCDELMDCPDCRVIGCKDPYEVCKEDKESDVYHCFCNFSSYLDNGTCKDCQNDCMKDFKMCLKNDQYNECDCIPDYLLVDEKCAAASSKWNSWTSWTFENYNTTSSRIRTCFLFVGANTNETQDCEDDLNDWTSWSDCINASNRIRGRTCGDDYFGNNCSGTVVEQIQLCPGFAYTSIGIQLNKTWSNDYFDSSSKLYEDLSSWLEDFNNSFKNLFKRLSSLSVFTTNLDVDYFSLVTYYGIWYSVEKKDLFDSCKQIESYLINQVQIYNSSISNFVIYHSDCCLSLLSPDVGFIIEYFTGLTNINLSLVNVNSTLSCRYDTSKSVNLSCEFSSEFDPDMAEWSYDNVFDCPAENDFSQDLINLNKSITTENAGEKAANLSSLLDQNTTLSVADMKFITNIITGIVNASPMPLNVTGDILSSVSSLLNQNKTLFNDANSIFNTSRNLLLQLDKMAVKQYQNVTLSENNLAFAAYFNEKNNSDVYIYSGKNNNLSVVISNNDPVNNSEIYQYITLPSQLFNQSKTLVYSYIYKEADLFVNMKNSTGNIDSDVLSATLNNIPVNKSNHSIILRFAKNSNVSGNTSCGFFKPNRRIWSTNGCNVINTSSSVIICECDHLTNFALLLNVAQSVPQGDTLGLTIVTWIGCGLSIAGLFFTIVSYSAFPKLRQKLAPKILLSLCVSLMSTLIIFLALGDRTKPILLCQIVASLLQFFVLSTFFWMAIEGLNLYRMFVKVFHSSSSSRIFLLKASAFAWGIPLVFTIATAASKPDLLGPGNSTTVPQVCVVRGYPFYFGMLLPICVIMAGNICFLFFVLRGIGGNSNLNNKIDCKKKVRIAFACSALLGLTWIFAIFAVGKATAVFQWLFCIFNSLQGFYIFLFYTVENKQVKEEWMLFLQKRFGCFKKFATQKLQNTTSGSIGNTLDTKID